MQLDRLIYSFSELGKLILQKLEEDDGLEMLIGEAYNHNRWFSPPCCDYALRMTAEKYLDEKKLKEWLGAYVIQEQLKPKTIAIIMAGNIPLVGWHDLQCVLISGHKALVKLSSKDEVLMKYMIAQLIKIDPQFSQRIEIVDRVSGFDAVIATGSNNTSRYFEYYFGKYPHIIRKGRNSVAILTGKEKSKELFLLGQDIFSYFGLGCRSVSKLYVPAGYVFIPLLDALAVYKDMGNYSKYDNNYSYHKSILLINRVFHYDTGFLLLKEDKSLASPVASLNYEYYNSEEDLKNKLNENKEGIQCIVGDTEAGIADTAIGNSQKPELWDYADKVDTMGFLLK